ncbi:MAG: hypothetical protein ACRDSM_13045, partial [Pseudonocardiaceae bacterium]
MLTRSVCGRSGSARRASRDPGDGLAKMCQRLGGPRLALLLGNRRRESVLPPEVLGEQVSKRRAGPACRGTRSQFTAQRELA